MSSEVAGIDTKRKHYIIITNLFFGALLLCVMGSLGVLVVVGLQGSDTRAKLIDCVEPTGLCYKDGQQRTKAAVETLNETIIAAAVCSDSAAVRRETEPARRIILVRECIIDNTKE